MTFDDWWGAYPTQEDYEANCRDAWEAGAASRDAEVAELKRDIEACPKGWHHSEVVALEKKRDQLREQVKMLRDVVGHVAGMRFSIVTTKMCEAALAATEPTAGGAS